MIPVNDRLVDIPVVPEANIPQDQMGNVQEADEVEPAKATELLKGEIAIENPDWQTLIQTCLKEEGIKKTYTKIQKKKQGPPPNAHRRMLSRSKGNLDL